VRAKITSRGLEINLCGQFQLPCANNPFRAPVFPSVRQKIQSVRTISRSVRANFRFVRPKIVLGGDYSICVRKKAGLRLLWPIFGDKISAKDAIKP